MHILFIAGQTARYGHKVLANLQLKKKFQQNLTGISGWAQQQFEEYHKEYVPFNWRGFWGFGTGAFGDMGCHIIDPAFKTVGLDILQKWNAVLQIFMKKCGHAAYHPESCPAASSIKLKFPGKNGKPDVKLYWMDGGILPERPEELGA